MHIFLVYLQRASPQERPLVAAILLQLDLLVSPFIVAFLFKSQINAAFVSEQSKWQL